MHIMVIEDDQELASRVRQRLQAEQHTVEVNSDGFAGLRLASATNSRFEVIILSAQIPGLNGVDVCKQLRSAGIATPILLCSTSDTIEACVAAFDAGADGYLIKPCSLDELVARVHALGRRGRYLGSLSALSNSGLADTIPNAIGQEPQQVTSRPTSHPAIHLQSAWLACKQILRFAT